MLLVHAAREEGGQQLVLLHPVVESVDHAIEGVASSGPFVQRRIVGHTKTYRREPLTRRHVREVPFCVQSLVLACGLERARAEPSPTRRFGGMLDIADGSVNAGTSNRSECEVLTDE